MPFLDLARARCSIRAYRPDPVEDGKLRAVLEAARLAPSAANRQPWGFVVVSHEADRKKFQAVYAHEWFWSAPVIIAACCDTKAAWVRRHDSKVHGDIDLAIAVDHLTLCAAEQGLGTCWICAFDPIRAREALELPSHVEPVALTPLGYPAEKGKPKDRKGLDDIVFWGRWGKKKT